MVGLHAITLGLLASFNSSAKDSFGADDPNERLCGYKHWFDPAVETAGIRDFTWYCLRHTFASRLVMAGVDLRTVAELMGHKTIQMTRRYAHLAPEHNLAAVEKLVSLTAYSAKSEEQSGDKAADASGPELLISGRSATRTATIVKDKALVEVAAAS
jgi:hypothetical protein